MKNLRFGVHPVQYPSKGGKEPIDLGTVAIWNEYGTTNAPPRPAFRMGLESAVAKNRKMIDAQLKNITQRVLSGRHAEIDRSLTVLHQTKNKHERIMLEVAGNKDRMSVLEDTPSDFLNMVVSYTKKADHDDEPDALAGAIKLWRTSPNLREYIMRAERIRR